MTDLFGVDLSQNQNVTNMTALRAAVDFVYMRVRRSNGSVDTKWRVFHDDMSGKPRAPYIFLRPPSEESLLSQFSSFWYMCGDYDWEWGPVIDAEYAGITSQVIKDAIATCRQVTGRRVVHVYTGYANAFAPGATAPPSGWATDDDIRIIGARYRANARANAWGNFGASHPNLDMVQYWDKATMSGIAGVVDVNVAHQIVTQSKHDVTSQEDFIVSLNQYNQDLIAGVSTALSTGATQVSEGSAKGADVSINRRILSIGAKQDALIALVQQLVSDQGIPMTKDELTSIIDQAVASHMVISGQITVTGDASSTPPT